jgi:hypothetical protein
MGIFSGATKAVGWLGEKLNLSWLTGGAAGAALTTPTSDITVEISVPELYPSPGGPFPLQHQGSFTLKVPDHSKDLGDIALNMAQNSLALVELAIAIQSIVDEEGGLRIKDQLDPYHYQVIKNALEENNEPVPEVREPNATVLSDLGGEITETGLLSNLATAADALGSVSPLVESYTSLGAAKYRVPGRVSTGEVGASFADGNNPESDSPINGFPPGTTAVDMTVWVSGYFPDYSLPYKIMNSAIQIQGFIMQYAVSNLRNAIDTDAKALVLKNLMGEFGKEVSDNAIKATGNTPPDWEEPTGQSGIRS